MLSRQNKGDISNFRLISANAYGRDDRGDDLHPSHCDARNERVHDRDRGRPLFPFRDCGRVYAKNYSWTLHDYVLLKYPYNFFIKT